MKVFDIVLKDLLHMFRNVFLLVFAFGLPLLTTGVFYAAFGGLGTGSSSGFDLPQTTVAVVNRDADGVGGAQLVKILKDERLSELIRVVEFPAEAEARAAVDQQQAGVALLIPPDFSAAIFSAEGTAAVELYQDPTLQIGPAVVRNVVGQALDGLTGTRLAVSAAQAQLAAASQTVDPAQLQAVGTEYAAWLTALSQAAPASLGLTVQAPVAKPPAPVSRVAQMISTIMAMMLVFYAFFTGTSAAQSILQEEEAGTLPRLLTTPTSPTTILAGKIGSVWMILLIQVGVLLAAAHYAFQINWGETLTVLLAGVGTATLAATFGLCITAFLKNTKQAGMVYSVVVNVAGWIGISRMFAGLIPGLGQTAGVLNRVSLISPQGWAASIWQAALAGQGVAEVGLTFAGMLGLSALLFGVAVFKFSRRYAN